MSERGREFLPVPDDFELVERGCEFVLRHCTAPVWIVFYANSTIPLLSVYRAYRAVAKVPQGRMPWTIDNRVIGSRDGVPTLGAVLELARGACTEAA